MKLNKCFIGFLLAVSVQVYGQGSPIDSMLAIVKSKSTKDINRMNTLNELGMAYWKNGEDSMAISFHKKAISESGKINFFLGEAKARLQLVRMELEHLEDVDGAHRQLDTAYQIAYKQKDDWIEAMSHFRRAQIYSMGFYEYNDTIPLLYDKARELFKKTGDKSMEGSVYSELASLEASEGKYSAAVDYLQKARVLQESTGDLKSLRATLPNLGVMYMNLKMYDKALEIFNEAKANAEKLNDQRVLAFIDNQRGFIYKEQKEYEKAIVHYQRAALLFSNAGAINISTNIYARIAEIYIYQNRLDSALRLNQYADSLYQSQIGIEEAFFHYTQINFAKIYLQKLEYNKAISYASVGRDTLLNTEVYLAEELAAYYKVLAEAYQATGNYQLALQNFKGFKNWSDTLVNDETNQRVLSATLTYDFEKKDQATQLQLQIARQQKLKQTQYFLLALLIISIAIGSYIFVSNKKLRTKNKELNQKNAEIEKALYTGQKMERKRLAAELHDNLNTQLAAIKWYLEAMQVNLLQEPNKKIYTKLLQMTDDLYRDLRLISHLLLPVALEHNDLKGAFTLLVAKLNESSKVHFTLHFSVTNLLPEKVNHQLYNICLELVNNVIKHSKATHANIYFQPQEKGSIELRVEDNGQGMPEKLVSGGIGLQNIKNRTHALAGKVIIQNKGNDGGASIRISVPSNKVIS